MSWHRRRPDARAAWEKLGVHNLEQTMSLSLILVILIVLLLMGRI